MLRIQGLRKSYNGNFTLSVNELEIGSGKITAILGPNGSGKSTLLRIIAGIERPDMGTVSFNGSEIGAGANASIAWRRMVTMVMQTPYLFSGSVIENVAYGLRLRGVPHHSRSQRASDALRNAGLEGYELRMVRELSGGEAQRVSLTRALVLEPAVLLLDEPTANIDRQNVARAESQITSLSGRKGLTVIIATHYLEQAYRLANDVVSIIDGRIVPAGPENVFQGDVKEAENGLKIVSLPGGDMIEVDTPLSGRVHLAIDPSDIIVSRRKLASSARNSLAGTLHTIATHGNRVRLTVAAGIDITVIMTKKSYGEMHLHPGETICLTFKTTAVKVF